MFSARVFTRRRVRLGTLAAIACGLCAAWSPLAAGRARDGGDLQTQSTFAATAWTATLPSVLAAPSMAPTLRLVSMVADDIDADGDLDVVANDGSLNLIVWINDGTGRLTRQADGPSAARPQLLSGLRLSDQPAGSRAVAHVPGVGPLWDAAIVSRVTTVSQRRFTGARVPRHSAIASTRAPRGPPSPTSAN